MGSAGILRKLFPYVTMTKITLILGHILWSLNPMTGVLIRRRRFGHRATHTYTERR